MKYDILDGNAIAADEYYNRHEVGTEPGDVCGRYPEPDENAPRGWKPKPCDGVMMCDDDTNGEIVCDTCGGVVR